MKKYVGTIFALGLAAGAAIFLSRTPDTEVEYQKSIAEQEEKARQQKYYEMATSGATYTRPAEAVSVPPEIMNKLRKVAERDWPEDYTTQEYWLNQQKQCYAYMTTVPDSKLKRKAQRDWPLDFSTQKYWYNEQIEAKNRLKKNY